MKLDDLNLFRLVVKNGSYTATSKKTGIPVATITRRMQALEDSLNIRLMNRHARKLSLTEAGEKFHQECGPLLVQLLKKTEHIADESRGAAGRIHIAAPENLTKRMMMPVFNRFMHAYPDISIDLTTTNQLDQLDPQEWDVIFKVGPQRDSSLIARKLHSIQDVLVASPDYLEQHPKLTHAEDLKKHALLKGHPLMRWQLVNPEGDALVNTDKGRLEANALNVVRRACSDGLGIALMPDVMVAEYLQGGQLMRVLDNWCANQRDIYMLYSHREKQPEKVRLFIDFVKQSFEEL